MTQEINLPPLPAAALQLERYSDNPTDVFTADDMQAYARQAVEADRVQRVPDGFVLVPKEPTPEMLQAMVSSAWLPGCYRAMLAASQPTPEQPQPTKPAEQASHSAWWALAMGAAASLEDAAMCMRGDVEAKKAAIGAAKHVREKCHEYWASSGAAPPQPVTQARDERAPTQAALDVLAERQRQISVEGWTPRHDDEHDDGSMAAASAAYSYYAAGGGYLKARSLWPWGDNWWKPGDWLNESDRRRNLVKAGALILAEIERLDRAALSLKDGSK